MTTKITIDPALVRGIVLSEKYQDAKVLIHPDSIEITSPDAGCEWDVYEDLAFDLEYCGYFEGSCYIDIHRLKDKAIEYLAGKGWDMIIYPNEIAVMLPMADPKSDGRPRMIFRIAEGFHPNKLSAELAAISFCWEQIQKEKTNEN